MIDRICQAKDMGHRGCLNCGWLYAMEENALVKVSHSQHIESTSLFRWDGKKWKVTK